MTTLKNLERQLLEKLSEEVELFGFDKTVKGQSFYKAMPHGRLALHLSFIRHSTDVDVKVDVAIRIDKLEDLVNKHKAFLPQSAKKGTFSLGAELGNIQQGKTKRWTITSTDDIPAVAHSIMEAVASIGLPYLERYSNLETALTALSGDDKAAWLHSPFHDERAMRAIGLAFLLGDPDRFSTIAAIKTDFLVARNHHGLPIFLDLKNDLEGRIKSEAA